MTIKNKRKKLSKGKVILIDLADIPFDIDKWNEHFKQTGQLIFKNETLTKRQYERKNKDIFKTLV